MTPNEIVPNHFKFAIVQSPIMSYPGLFPLDLKLLGPIWQKSSREYSAVQCYSHVENTVLESSREYGTRVE